MLSSLLFSCYGQFFVIFFTVKGNPGRRPANYTPLSQQLQHWLGTATQLAKINNRTIILADANIQVSDVVTCLGVVIDSQLTFADNVKKLFTTLDSSAQYAVLWLPALWIHYIACPDLQSRGLLQQRALRPDDVCEVHLRQLQSVLNAAAWLITGKRKFDHITSNMRDDLHWLPVRQRIQFKLCTLVSKCLHRTAPLYLTDMCASRCRQRLVAHVYGRARAATSGFRAVDWHGMDREASSCLNPQLGTRCRRSSAICRNHLLSVVSWRLNYSVGPGDNSRFVIAFCY